MFCFCGHVPLCPTYSVSVPVTLARVPCASSLIRGLAWGSVTPFFPGASVVPALGRVLATAGLSQGQGFFTSLLILNTAQRSVLSHVTFLVTGWCPGPSQGGCEVSGGVYCDCELGAVSMVCAHGVLLGSAVLCPAPAWILLLEGSVLAGPRAHSSWPLQMEPGEDVFRKKV